MEVIPLPATNLVLEFNVLLEVITCNDKGTKFDGLLANAIAQQLGQLKDHHIIVNMSRYKDQLINTKEKGLIVRINLAPTMDPEK